MYQFFVSPKFDDDYQQFAYSALHYTLQLILVILFIFTIVATSVEQLRFLPIAYVIFGSSYYLLHTNRPQVAGIVFLSGLWTIITLAAFTLNGIRNAGLIGYVTVIIYSAIILNTQAVIFTTVLSILSAFLLLVGELHGVLPLQSTPLFIVDRFFQNVIAFGAAGILLSGASRVVRRSVELIRFNEQTLREQNETLQEEIKMRVHIEERLRASEEKYRLLFENIGIMAGVYEYDGTITLINDAGARVLESTPDSLIGRKIQDFFNPEDIQSALERQQRVIDTGIPETIEGHTNLRGGREIYYLRHVFPLPTRQGTDDASRQVLVLTTDLTTQKQAEQQERALIIEKEKNAFLTDFFSTISHDLKTPLAVINTSLYLLDRAPDEAYRQAKIDKIREQVRVVDKYIQDILMISRLEHLPNLTLQKTALRPLVEEVVDLLRPRAEEKSQHYQFTNGYDLPDIPMEREQMHRALVNLIENAINYTPENGRVEVSTFKQNGAAIIQIADSGIGIAEDKIPEIFERFYRTDEAQMALASGTGLGLAIVKKIIDMHKGTIEVKSQPNKGTIFRVSLPIYSPEYAAQNISQSP